MSIYVEAYSGISLFVLGKVVSHFVIKYLEKMEVKQLTKQSVSELEIIPKRCLDHINYLIYILFVT